MIMGGTNSVPVNFFHCKTLSVPVFTGCTGGNGRRSRSRTGGEFPGTGRSQGKRS